MSPRTNPIALPARRGSRGDHQIRPLVSDGRVDENRLEALAVWADLAATLAAEMGRDTISTMMSAVASPMAKRMTQVLLADQPLEESTITSLSPASGVGVRLAGRIARYATS